jgi:hypothetical protein
MCFIIIIIITLSPVIMILKISMTNCTYLRFDAIIS